MVDRGPTYRKTYLPPLFGWPKERRVDYPQNVPSQMWLVRLDDRFNQNPQPLRIQTVPLELNVRPESNWAIIPTIGRNNPFYMYTGGEDTLEFTLDWYATDSTNPNQVIDACRWVESLQKADRYIDGPPRVKLIYGELYKYTTWIVKSAPYKLSLFSREKGMLPRQAYQEITLCRVTENNTGILERQIYA